jgi:hypothetical protein
LCATAAGIATFETNALAILIFGSLGGTNVVQEEERSCDNTYLISILQVEDIILCGSVKSNLETFKNNLLFNPNIFLWHIVPQNPKLS